MEKILQWKFIGKEQMTGLPEYRNGGLLVDFGLLNPRIPALLKSFDLPVPETLPPFLELPPLHASHHSIVEFRAVTVIMLDRLAEGIRKKTGNKDLSLPQVLEAGTWKAVSLLLISLTPPRLLVADTALRFCRAVKSPRSCVPRPAVLLSVLSAMAPSSKKIEAWIGEKSGG